MLSYGKENAKDVLKNKIVFVDFWAPWCAPCRMLSPIFEEVSEKFKEKEVVFAKCNVDDDERFAMKHGIASIPCVICFKDGVEVDRNLGLVSSEELELFVEKNLK